MSDYRLETKLKNNRIFGRIAKLGYRSIAEFCKDKGFGDVAIGELINMKVSPLRRGPSHHAGTWRDLVLRLAEALSVEPEDLFSEQQLVGLKNGNVFVHELSEEDVLMLMEPPSPFKLLEEKEMSTAIDDCLSGLTPQEAQVIRLRFGFDGDQLSLGQTGDQLGVTRQRIIQIEKKALRKMRHPSRADKLKELI